MKNNDRFYDSKQWKNKRNNILRRDKYQCRECGRYGRVTQATVVHHIFPLENYPEYKLVSDNLLSLCNGCHGTMHNRITNELTQKGNSLKERMKFKIEKLPPLS